MKAAGLNASNVSGIKCVSLLPGFSWAGYPGDYVRERYVAGFALPSKADKDDVSANVRQGPNCRRLKLKEAAN
ncbi:hypothetical protein ACVWW1_000392 [Bradyrhizobium sp. JR3.5]